MTLELAVIDRADRAQPGEFRVEILDLALTAKLLGGGERVERDIGIIFDDGQGFEIHRHAPHDPLAGGIAGKSPPRHPPAQDPRGGRLDISWTIGYICRTASHCPNLAAG